MLIKHAYHQALSFILAHKQSLIHELDRNFIDQLYTAQRQLHILEQHPEYSDTFATEINHIKNNLSTIEDRYKKNSPAIALLGPIGTTAIVIKENKLQKKLLDTLNDFGKVLSLAVNNNAYNFSEAHTINSALQTNKKMLKNIIH